MCTSEAGRELDVDRRLQVADEVGGGEVVDRRAAHRVAVGRPIPELDDLYIQAADPRGSGAWSSPRRLVETIKYHRGEI